jgi:pimeloyl-ACP methyl ester carboxylesterase
MKTLIVKSLGAYLNFLAYVSPGKAKGAAFDLFCRPFRTPINEKQKVFFASAEKFTIENDDHVIQGYKWGSGEKKIVFLHGWQSHTYRWKSYIEALPTEEYTIYALDAPGHGLSNGKFLTVPLYSSIIHQLILQLGDVHAVVGHSLGSFSLLYTFYKNPLMPVRKVVLMAPPGEASDFLDLYKKTLGLSQKVADLVVENFVDLYDVKPDYFSTAKFAAAVKVPGIIIHDEDDQEAPYRYAQSINRAWPKSKLITTKGMGHNLKSASIVQTVVGFISGSLEEAEFTITPDSCSIR